MPSTDLLTQLDRLAQIEPGPFPVVSLYLNMQPDQHGRDNFEPFLRKELDRRIATYAASGPERESLEKDAAAIRDYLADVEPSANGLALFSCSGADLFEAISLAAPVGRHRLSIADQPHLYPLAQLVDRFPRYIVLVADTRSARLFVVAADTIQRTNEIEGTKTRRHSMGGWSQARYQRHVENYHLQHAKEVADALGRVVRDESIDAIILAGDEVILPLLREQFTKEVADRIVDTLALDIRAPEHEILEMTRDVMHRKDEQNDRERVEALLGEYRGNGLATVGVENTKRALEIGQVDELVLTAISDVIDVPDTGNPGNAGEARDRSVEERTADELIVKARQTGARIRFIEDGSLLAAAGGVGAFLRFAL
jgi:peptide subunit release factor 1 (eRF1)